MQARDELVEENLPLVHYVLRRFRDRGADYEDLFQYGCMGLLKAIDRFDPAYGARFSTYAVPVILGEVRRFLRDDGPVHVSRTIHDNALRVERYREEFMHGHAREPTVDEISDGAGICREDVVLALNANGRVRSLSEPVGGDGELRLMDVIGTETMGEVDQRLLLAGLLKELTPQERTIIIRRYFRSNTQSEIARDLGVSQVQVSRLEGKILKRMRERAEGE
ncbi:MAG: SigB/SigF/SigG family RNA polymerase sigma factor [Eubacteriales bacterium]|nr:SigB/SigF/SigG family RNA polymerase sigma factor [Eubacteriales bacterium]